MSDPKRIVTLIPAKPLAERQAMKRQLRVAAYCRVSTEEEEQQSSYEAQCTYYTDKIMTNPEWTMAGIFADEGITGTSTKKRDDFNRMIRRCKAKKIDLILTKSISRFARNTLDTINYTRMLRAMGIGVIFEKENINTLDMDSEMLITMLGAFAQAESESISRNVAWGKRQAIREGKVHVNFKRLYGYVLREDGIPDIDSEKANVVRLIFERYVAGDSLRMITYRLNNAGILNPSGEPEWKSATIRSILMNEKYCGDCILQKTVTIDCISKTRKVNQGEAPMYIVENNHPAIISREVFNRAQEELIRRQALQAKSDKTSITATGKHSKYALTEVLQCAECGSRYRRVTWTARGRKKIVWRCISRLDYGTKHCKDSITVEEEALHGAVVRALNRFHAEDESTYLTLMKATIGEAIGINGGSEEIDLLTRRIDALNKRMLDLVNETVAAGKDVESSEDEFKNISDQIEQLNRRIAAIQESIHKDGSRQARLEEIQNIIAERNANETQYDDSIVRQMIECIKVHNDGKLTIIFGGGYEIEETL